MSHPPLILAVVVCERILHDPQTRQPSLINLLSALQVTQVPVVLPVLGVLVSLTDGYGDSTLVLELRESEEACPPLARVELNVHWGDPRHVLDIPCLINQVRFPALGEYRLRVSCAGAMAERRIVVHLPPALPPVPPPTSPPPASPPTDDGPAHPPTTDRTPS